MRRRTGWLWAALGASLLAAGAHAEDPAVARPRFQVGADQHGSGTAFFLGIGGRDEPVAVTTAHAFEIDQLRGTREVAFVRGRTGGTSAISTRLLARGRPFSAPGAAVRDDFLVFALDTPLTGARVLYPDPRAPAKLEGARVRILGVPAAIPSDEDDIFGTVRTAADDRIEVRLDVPEDLRGWGGAPVIAYPDGGVVGVLEAALPDAGTLVLWVAPIAAVVDAARQPLEGGLGTDFAKLAPEASRTAEAPAPPVTPEAERTAPRVEAEPEGRAPGTPGAATAAGDAKLPSVDDALVLTGRPPPAAGPDGPLLGKAGALSTKVEVKIEQPADGALVGEEGDAFVAGRALALLGEFRRFDVMIVIDTSDSTKISSGADINGNGVVGQDRLMGVLGSTDPGDSILSAEIAAARRVMENLDSRNTRVGLITFSGTPPPPPGTIVIGGSNRPDAITEEPLTSNYRRVERALEHVRRRGPDGQTNMGAAVELAIRELRGLRGSISTEDPDSEKVVLFFTDGQPTLPYAGGFVGQNVRHVMRKAASARRAHVTVHTFAIGPDALEGPVAAVELAEITGGYFTPVRKPGDLVEVIENVSFANIEDLTVQNVTLDQPASQLLANADGSYGALVPLQEGKNRIRVRAVAGDGTAAEAFVTVVRVPGTPKVPTPPELVALRNKLLERKLLALKRGRIEAERAEAERVRRELRIEIEKERKVATERAAKQRKQLDLEVERREAEGAGGTAPEPEEGP